MTDHYTDEQIQEHAAGAAGSSNWCHATAAKMLQQLLRERDEANESGRILADECDRMVKESHAKADQEDADIGTFIEAAVVAYDWYVEACQERDALAAEVEDLRLVADRAREALKELRSKLPRTADGVPVVPGMKLYHPRWGQLSLDRLPRNADGCGMPTSHCYSTPEAAGGGE